MGHRKVQNNLLSRCNCDSLAADPDSFCSNGEVCKVSVVIVLANVLVMINTVAILQDCVCGPRFPPGCECDPYSNIPGELYLRCVLTIPLVVRHSPVMFMTHSYLRHFLRCIVTHWIFWTRNETGIAWTWNNIQEETFFDLDRDIHGWHASSLYGIKKLTF